MERKPDNDMLVKGFRMVLEETYRDDLEPHHREYVNESLNILARNCVDSGLGMEIAQVRDDVACEQRLIKLRQAWVAGEISL